MRQLALMVLDVFARGGGGGSGGGGGGGGGGSFSGGSGGSGGGGGGFITLIIWAVIIIAFIYTSIKAKQLYKQKLAKTRAAMLKAAAADPAWNPDAVQAYIKQVYFDYQQDWSSFNLEHMKTYLVPRFFEHNQLMLGVLQSMQRRNNMANVRLLSSDILDADDEPGTAKDTFEVAINGAATDSLVNTAINQTLYTDSKPFKEYWTFTRDENVWKLDHIRQETEYVGSTVKAIQDFAQANNLFFSPDWGWLLLPQRGQLFSQASFMHSDINNHCIGRYHDLTIQLYAYKPNPEKSTAQSTIAQVILPKSYGNIVVRHKSGGFKWFGGGIKGLNKLEMESGDFNKRYEVFADDVEQVTSFELLHPVFIEKMNALPFQLNIEVVDNVVYLYTSDTTAKYDSMLSILKDAFEEMKL